jgi:hypothetical protein
MKLSQQIANWNRRARQRNLAHDLTAVQWWETLELFEFKCAYCGAPAQTMDHWIPLGITGDDPILTGSTAGNCLPCCWRCNQRKGFSHPTYWEKWCVPPERVAAIHQFVERHARRKYAIQQIQERFDRWWVRTGAILQRFQHYAEVQSERHWEELWSLSFDLQYRWYSSSWNVRSLWEHLRTQEQQATSQEKAATYHAALSFLEAMIDTYDPERLTLEP